MRAEEKVIEMGPLEDDKEHVRPDPLSLPDKFVWDVIDLADPNQVSQMSAQSIASIARIKQYIDIPRLRQWGVLNACMYM